MAQFMMRRGSVTPMMQFAFELLTYSMLDVVYNLILSLASGYYRWEKLMEALKNRELNKREFLRIILKFPVFSSNLLGLGLQSFVYALNLSQSRDSVISSVGESAIGYDVRSVIKALQGWASFVTGEVPKQHPAVTTYNAFGRLIPGIGNTLVKMLIMQAYGELSTSGTRGRQRTKSSYVLDRINELSDQNLRDSLIRSMFIGGEYMPSGKKLPTGGYVSELGNKSMMDTLKAKLPEPKLPEIPEVLKPKQESIVKQATTPLKAPM